MGKWQRLFIELLGEYYSCLNSTYLKNDIIESKSNEIESKQDKNYFSKYFAYKQVIIQM